MRPELTGYEARKPIDYEIKALRSQWHGAGGVGRRGGVMKKGRVGGWEASDIEPTLFLIIELSYWQRLFLEINGGGGREKNGGRERRRNANYWNTNYNNNEKKSFEANSNEISCNNLEARVGGGGGRFTASRPSAVLPRTFVSEKSLLLPLPLTPSPSFPSPPCLPNPFLFPIL